MAVLAAVPEPQRAARAKHKSRGTRMSRITRHRTSTSDKEPRNLAGEEFLYSVNAPAPPAQSPGCGRAQAPVLAGASEAGEWYQGAPAPWTPGRGTTSSARRRCPSPGRPTMQLRTAAAGSSSAASSPQIVRRKVENRRNQPKASSCVCAGQRRGETTTDIPRLVPRSLIIL